MMWFLPKFDRGGLCLRHWAEQGDNLKQFGWIKHDGRSFRIQNIQDRAGDELETSYVKMGGGKHGGEWSNRIKVTGSRKVHWCRVCM